MAKGGPRLGAAATFHKEEIDRMMGSLQRRIGRDSKRARQIIGQETVRAIKESRPVLAHRDTGTMQRGYGFRLEGKTIKIVNRARSAKGFPYPMAMEKYYKVTSRAIRNERANITFRVQAHYKTVKKSG